MIYIDRQSVKKPAILDSERMKQEFEKLKAFYDINNIKSDFKRYKFSRITDQKEVMDALEHLFNGKCAYCEDPIKSTSKGDNDLYRPKDGSMNIDGSFDPDHYWWLAYEWLNMYLSCSACNRRYKRNNFPVEGNRAAVMGDLSVEKPLLLDPCNPNDFLEQHIGYEKEEAIGFTKRGQQTIKILGLNRSALRRQRRQELRNLAKLIAQYNEVKSLPNFDTSNSIALIKDHTGLSSPFLDCKWGNYKSQLLEVYGNEIPEYLPFYGEQEPSRESNTGSAKKKQKSRKSYSLDKMGDEGKSTYFGQSRWITKVKISNFKIIEDLELSFAENESEEIIEPWMALLGENGTGKSTILQAIALTLAGQERLDKLDLKASAFVNRNSDVTSGWVKMYLNDRTRPITLNFDKSTNLFTVTPKAPQLIVRAYGATRLFSKSLDNLHSKDFTFLENLFNPLKLLLNGNKWLTEKIKDNELFQEITKSLADLLSLDDDQYFYPDQDEEGNQIVCLKLYANKEGISLDELSAGYKAILALALDIMMGFGKVWPSIFNAQGIVLVDEIGVHLHPRWKMRIISALRKTFPGINFIIATHEPLCLRGLEEGEVILIRLDENKEIEIVTDLPSPKSMQVGQLLTSIFGLYTTLDPEMERKFTEFNELQSLRKHTEIQEERLEGLKLELKDHLIEDSLTGKLRPNTLLGETMDEAIAFKAVEKEYAKDDERSLKKELESLSADELDEIKSLWTNN
ncbi:AAA family ATPase [Jejuia spongiicola]|uniref:AAA family ATPase n=1 Tax=Jejuia spongiicola TaxID=2942207 RepID=A0ABT0QD04_9FLAO|nr:AAA family ATPase [Jejuia spongiicola]MCL6294869.1 AAA family ATPase [Jejuia spongiicola]